MRVDLATRMYLFVLLGSELHMEEGYYADCSLNQEPASSMTCMFSMCLQDGTVIPTMGMVVFVQYSLPLPRQPPLTPFCHVSLYLSGAAV